MGNKGQVGYPSDVSDEEWAFVAPYLALCREDAAQRSHSFTGGVQRAALAGEDGGALADDAQRSAAVAGGVPADATLDTSRMLRDHGGGSAFSAARVRGAQAAAHGDGGGQPDAAVHAGVGRTGGIRRRQAAQRAQGACS